MRSPSSMPDADALLRHSAWVRSLALQLCADVHAAEDAVQETWAAILQKPPRHGANLRAFLAQLLRRALGQRWRSDDRRQRREIAAAVAGGDAEHTFVEATADAAQRAELHRTLVALVLELPEPQKGLVLLHYFDGVDVAELGRRSGITPDAVRAHLRRARERLRERLDRHDGPARRGFALLVAATSVRPGAPAVGFATLTAITSAMKTKIALVSATVVAALLVCLQFAASDVAPRDTMPASGRAAGVAAAPAVGSADASRDAPSVEPTASSRVTAETVAVRVSCRLIGLRDDTPWTAALRIDLGGKIGPERTPTVARLDVQPARDGSFVIELPQWAPGSAEFVAQFLADDPFHLPLDHTIAGETLGHCGLLARDPFPIEVTPVAVAGGRVVNAAHHPVPAADIRAFALCDGLPSEQCLATTSTDANGRYVLQIPAAANLVLVATAMQERLVNGERTTGRFGAIATEERVRPELLPAAATLASRFGRDHAVPDFVLPEAGLVDGSVHLQDGTPTPGAHLQLRVDGDAKIVVPSLAISWWRDGSVAPAPWCNTDNLGRFTMYGDPRREAALLYSPGPQNPTQQPIERRVTPPATVDIRLDGRKLRVRSRVDGKPGDVKLLAGWAGRFGLMSTDQHGELELVVPDGQGFELWTRSRGLTPFHARYEPGEVPPVVEIDVQRPPPAAVTLRLEPRVQRAQVAFVPTERPGAQPVTSGQFIASNDEPFRFGVPPGRYRLEFGPCASSGDDSFLLPGTHDVEVLESGADLRVRVAFGGRVRIQVKSADGLRVDGTTKLRDAGGAETIPLFRGAGDSRERAGLLLRDRDSETQENLAQGTYEVLLDLGPRGIHRRSVDVRAREVAEVTVRLP